MRFLETDSGERAGTFVLDSNILQGRGTYQGPRVIVYITCGIQKGSVPNCRVRHPSQNCVIDHGKEARAQIQYFNGRSRILELTSLPTAVMYLSHARFRYYSTQHNKYNIPKKQKGQPYLYGV